jgi:hypothetical protein
MCNRAVDRLHTFAAVKSRAYIIYGQPTTEQQMNQHKITSVTYVETPGYEHAYDVGPRRLYYSPEEMNEFFGDDYPEPGRQSIALVADAEKYTPGETVMDSYDHLADALNDLAYHKNPNAIVVQVGCVGTDMSKPGTTTRVVTTIFYIEQMEAYDATSDD